MPVGETEQHPFLHMQIANFQDKKLLSHYCKLIVGTFPIYAITSSTPVQPEGVIIRNNWLQAAFMKYFYGSRKNYFWKLFAACFNVPVPANPQQAIALLNEQQFLITDVVAVSERNEYSASDSDLTNKVFNCALVKDILKNSQNLKLIYFTSMEAKRQLCTCFNIAYQNIAVEDAVILNNPYRLILLVPPANSGLRRGMDTYYNVFQRSPKEMLEENGYCLDYRERYYCHFLKIKCNEIKFEVTFNNYGTTITH